MVNEACNLIMANLDRRKYDLFCEQPYRLILPPRSQKTHLSGRARADLVVVSKKRGKPPPRNENFTRSVLTVIEVKRIFSPTGNIVQDLRRLAEFKRLHGTAGAFLFLVSEGLRPPAYVNDGGSSKAGFASG